MRLLKITNKQSQGTDLQITLRITFASLHIHRELLIVSVMNRQLQRLLLKLNNRRVELTNGYLGKSVIGTTTLIRKQKKDTKIKLV